MRRLFIALVSLSILFGCENTTQKNDGGSISLYESEKYRSLFPHNAIDAIGIKVVNQIFQGLVQFNERTLEIEPAIAESWEITNENTRYTFHLRKNVKFHSNQIFETEEDRLLTADDVIFSFNLLSTYNDNNLGFHSTFKDLVKGATEHYIMSANKDYNDYVKGINKLDDYTIQIDLEHPSPYFLYLLALPYCSVIPELGYQYYKETLLIGTGPFQLNEKSDEKIRLVKNEDYYLKDEQGKKLPYLNDITFNFRKSVDDQVVAFTKNKIDVLYKMNDEKFQTKYEALNLKEKVRSKYLSSPHMAVSYCGFNLQDDILSNKKVRQAINYAVDVNLVRDVISKGSRKDHDPIHGITPPAFEPYNSSNVNPYPLNIDKAKALLAEAGYPNGKGLDTIYLDINKGRGNNQLIANEIKRQLKEHININIAINVMPFGEKIDKTKSGKSQFFKAGWIADYPHPQNFLSLFYGRDVPNKEEEWQSYPNTTRYKNEEFDKLYEKAMRVPLKETYAYLEEAEKILMEDAPAIILWYGKNQLLLNPKVHNYPMNVMGYTDFSKVWLQQ